MFEIVSFFLAERMERFEADLKVNKGASEQVSKGARERESEGGGVGVGEGGET